MRPSYLPTLLIPIVLLSATIASNIAVAQSKTTINPNTIRALDNAGQRLQKSFADDLTKLADGYEEAGDTEKAQQTLKRVLRIDPEREKIQERLDEMQNRVFDDNEVSVEVDVASGWVKSGLQVREGKAVRLQAEGSFKLIMNANVGADGVTTKDVGRDMARGIKLGALMGIVYPLPQPSAKGKGRPRPSQKSAPGQPFAIGAEQEFTPTESGMLFLRLNVPAGTKSVGKIKVTVSGNFE